MKEHGNMFEAIPAELKNIPNWLVWQRIDTHKRPYNANNGSPMAGNWMTDKSVLTDFNTAVKRSDSLDGIGFVLTGTNFIGIDIDKVIGDGFKVDKKVQGLVHDLVTVGGGYFENSVSGTGYHVIIPTDYPISDLVQKQHYDKYHVEFRGGKNSWLTVSGNGTYIPKKSANRNMRDVALEFYQMLSEDVAETHSTSDFSMISSQPFTKRSVKDTLAALKRNQHTELAGFALDRLDHGYKLDDDKSTVDIKVARQLYYWSNSNIEVIRPIMIKSALNREKWFEKRRKVDWLQQTLNKLEA